MRPVPVVLLGAVLLLGGCARQEPAANAPATPAAPVHAVPVESASVAATVRAVGVLAPRDEVRLAFKVGGMIDRLSVDVGDRVARGQVLATLKRGEIDASVAQATEGVSKAKRDLERAERLRADEVATEEQVQDLTTAYKVAQANLDAVRFNAQYARIVAPADGVVQGRLAEPDELVAGGQPVLVLGSTDTGWVVRAALADRDAVRVNVGDVADVGFDAFPGQPFPGKVTRVAAAADPTTGTFDVEIEVQPAGARFVRGLVGKVTLGLGQGASSASSTVVPVSALVEASGSIGTVYILDATGTHAQRKQVTVGSIVGDRVIVEAGLEPGQRVVTDGAAWLTEGHPVQVVGQQG
ncbi:MAG TPA: efflux RND transporter periplasmic adaptor subunit [Steroidobacteraceae bacterium]